MSTWRKIFASKQVICLEDNTLKAIGLECFIGNFVWLGVRTRETIFRRHRNVSTVFDMNTDYERPCAPRVLILHVTPRVRQLDVRCNLYSASHIEQ